jgi:hypothetical protein
MNAHTDLTTIRGTVVAIAPAPASNQSGKIKLQDGMILSAFKEKLDLVYAGESYAFGVQIKPGEKGRVFHNVKSVTPLALIKDNPQFVSTAEVVAQRRPTAQAQPPQRQHQAEQPGNAHANWTPPRQEPMAPPAQHGAAFPVEWQRPTHPRDSRRMFVCAMLGQDIAAGRVAHNEDDYVLRVEMWSRVYDRTFGLSDPE